jgi:hypothetical protein
VITNILGETTASIFRMEVSQAGMCVSYKGKLANGKDS